MDKLEAQLNKLPSAKLSLAADTKIKSRLFKAMAAQNFNRLGSLSWLALKPVGRTVAIASLAVLLLVGTSIYAYASGGVTQGSALYPLKRAVEALEETVNLSPAAKVKTYSKFSERRLQEALILSQKNTPANEQEQEVINEHIKTSLDEAADNISSVVNQAKTGAERGETEAIKQLKEKNEDTTKYLRAIEDKAQSEHNEEVIKKVNEVRDNIRQYQSILEDKAWDEDKPKSDRPEVKEPSDSKPEVEGQKIRRDIKSDQPDGRRRQEDLKAPVQPSQATELTPPPVSTDGDRTNQTNDNREDKRRERDD